MINIIGKRYYFLFFSLAIIIPGMILLAIWGIPLSIDFKGGTMLEVRFASGTAPEPAKVVSMYTAMGISDPTVFTSGKDSLIIRSVLLSDTQRITVPTQLESTFNDKVTVLRYDSVGPSVSSQVAQNAALAIFVSSVLLIAYITFAFRGEHGLRYGVATVIALVHDLAIIFSIAVIGGHFWGWQIDTLYFTAVLTVIAFSAQDTIVVLDRMRENARIYRQINFEVLTNHSVVQSLTRSINTQLMTVDFMLVAMALFGGVTLREFSIALLIGMLSGTYSSGFIAAPLLVIWENKEWKTWFRRKDSAAA